MFIAASAGAAPRSLPPSRRATRWSSRAPGEEYREHSSAWGAAAGGLRGDPAGDAGHSGDGPPARPAAARVPSARALRGRGAPATRPRGRRGSTGALAAAAMVRDLAGGEPDARDTRDPPRGPVSAGLRDAGQGGDRRGGSRSAARARPRTSRSCFRWSPTRPSSRQLREHVVNVAEEALRRAGTPVPYSVGTMIELPRACLIAGRLADHADFFSFGTNDLTQTTLGLSRDDAEGSFINVYLERGLLDRSPFEVDRRTRASVSWCGSAPIAVATRIRGCGSASVASTGATRRASVSSIGSSSTT